MESTRCSQGIIDVTETKTFEQENKKICENVAGAKVDATKTSTGFSRMSVTLNLLRFGALPRDNL